MINGAKFIQVLKALGYETLFSFAEASGIPESEINKIADGMKPISEAVIDFLIKKHSLNASYLLFVKDGEAAVGKKRERSEGQKMTKKEEIESDITSRLFVICKMLKMTQKEFAAYLGIYNQGLVSKYELSQLCLPNWVMLELFNLGISMNWLIAGEGLPFRQEFEGQNIAKCKKLMQLANIESQILSLNLQRKQIEKQIHEEKEAT